MEDRFNQAIEREVVYEELPQLHPIDTENVKAIVFDGVLRQGKMTQVFAYYGKPQNIEEGQSLPAMLLIHGGGGHAFSNWVEAWNQRGYIAIAIDTVGGFPNDNQAGAFQNQEQWLYEIPKCINHRNGILAPQNDEMGNAQGALEEQWIYHAIHSAILAHNILIQDKDVDSSKIGVTGISWGGVTTSLLMGYDKRFAFAIPIYGSGYLREGYAPVEHMFYKPNVENLWLAEERLGEVKHPVLWIGSNMDHCFSVPPISMSYESTCGQNEDTRISLIHHMLHSHPDGWAPKEIGRYADAMVGAGVMLPKLQTEIQKTQIHINIQILGESQGEEIQNLCLFYLTEDIVYGPSDKFHREMENSCYMLQEWNMVDVAVESQSMVIDMPQEAKGYYVELKTKYEGDEYITTTPYRTV